MNKKGFAKISLSVLIGIAALLTFYTLNVAALIFPGTLVGSAYPASVNLTKGDMFFANGNSVFIVVNYTCAPTTVCNQSLIVTGNFSEIGGSQSRAAVFKGNNSLNTWALFELNDTVDMTSLSNIIISPKTIYLNATDPYDGAVFNNQLNATVVLVNMSTLPSCPPAGQGIQLPPVVRLLNGNYVNTTCECIDTCSVEDVAQLNNTNATGDYYNLCGPVFNGPSSTNFTELARTGNFSNFHLVIEIPGKVKLNFITNVSMDTPQKAQSLFEFAIRNMMSGPKIGIDDRIYNSSSADKPNLNLSAMITFYNITSRFGYQGEPQIYRYASGSSNGALCPSEVCSNSLWDNGNLTFNVSGFSDYSLNASNPVSLSLSNGTMTNNLNFTTTYGIPLIANCSNTYTSSGSCAIYRNGTPVANITNDVEMLGVGTYLYKVNTSGSSGYSANATGETLFVTVNKAIPTVSLYTSGTYSNKTSVYPNSSINVTAISSAAGLYVRVWRNATLIQNTTSVAIDVTQWAAYPNNFTTQVLGNANYTDSAAVTLWWNVSKGPSLVSLFLNGTENNTTYTYPSGTNATGASTGTTALLWRNETSITNPNIILLANATYVYKVNASANENYTANDTGIWYYAYMSKGTPSLTLAIDGVGSDKSVTSGAQTNTTGSESNNGDDGCTYNLYRNDAGNITNANPPYNTQTLTAGTYVYVYNTSGCGNYTSASITRTLTVSSSSSNTGGTSGGLTTSTYATPYVRIAKDNANITLTSLTTSGKMIATIARFDGISIRGINITVVNSVANIKLAVTRLSVLPQTISYNINGKVFNYISIDESNITNADLKTVSIRFAVNKTWLSNNGVADSNITLYRWNGNSWTELNAAKSGEDSLEVFYLVDSPGLSVFLVGTKGGVAQAVTTPACTESWTCGEWSACADGQQTRTCTDANACGTSVSMPSITQSCTTEAAVQEPTQSPSADYTTPFVVLIVAIAASIAIFMYREKITSHLHWMQINHIKRKRENAKDMVEGKVHVKAAE